MAKKPVQRPTEPLQTRHVFLDTEIYRRAGFNLSNSQFSLLKDLIEEGRISLHYTDITLAEVKRQLSEDTVDKVAQLKRLARDFKRLAQISEDSLPTLPVLDSHTVAASAFKGFVDILISDLDAHSILAMEVHARKVFQRYFAGEAPFDVRGSKEFPDAFVLEGLLEYCMSNDIKMYVVSGDAAMRKGADAKERLIGLTSIDDVLAAAAADTVLGLEPVVEAVFESPGFDEQLIDAIMADLDFVTLIYHGNLPDGSAVEPQLEEILNVDAYSFAAHDGNTLGLILNVSCVIRAKIEFTDPAHLIENDDDISPTVLSEASYTQSDLKIYVSIDLETMRFRETELLTKVLYFE